MARDSFFTTSNRDSVTTLRFLHHEKLAGTDLSVVSGLWDSLESLEARPPKVLLIHAPSHLMTPRNMDAVWRPLSSPYVDIPNNLRPPVPMVQLSLEREEHALHRFIRQIRRIPALVVGVLQGEIDFPFLGPALACDYRIIAEDTVFVNRILELGSPPMGAAPWFLTRFLGQGKAMEMLLRVGSVTAREAYDLSLVHEVVPLSVLEDRAQQVAERLASQPTSVLAALKRVTVAAEQTLDDYLEVELRDFRRCVASSEQLAGRQ